MVTAVLSRIDTIADGSINSFDQLLVGWLVGCVEELVRWLVS